MLFDFLHILSSKLGNSGNQDLIRAGKFINKYSNYLKAVKLSAKAGIPKIFNAGISIEPYEILKKIGKNLEGGEKELNDWVVENLPKNTFSPSKLPFNLNYMRMDSNKYPLFNKYPEIQTAFLKAKELIYEKEKIYRVENLINELESTQFYLQDQYLDDLLSNSLSVDLIATPIARARDLTPIDRPKEISADV